MTYFDSAREATDKAPYPPTTVCFECGQPVHGPVVRYDGYTAAATCHSFMFHRSCALAVANRLITDAWPNRGFAPRVEISEDIGS